MTEDAGPTAELERIQLLCELGRYAEAGARLGPLLARDPQSATAWTLLSYIHLAEDQYADALVAAERALASGPVQEWPLRLSGLALDGLGRRPEAIQRLRLAVEVAPDAWTAQSALARLLSHRRSTRREALALAEAAVGAAPNEAGPYLALAEVHRRGRRAAESESAVRHALRVAPDNASAHHELARLRLGVGRAAKPDLVGAATGFADVLATDPQHEAGAYNLGLVLRLFIARVSVLVFLDAAFLGRALSDHTDVGSRAVPVLALGVPAFLGVRFVRQLSPVLRAELRRVLFSRRLLGPSTLLAGAAITVLAGAVAPAADRGGLAAVAAGLALVGRLMMVAAHESYQRSAPGRARGHRVDTAVLVLLFVVFLPFTALLLVALWSSQSVPLLLTSAVSVAVLSLLGWHLWRRARQARRKSRSVSQSAIRGSDRGSEL